MPTASHTLRDARPARPRRRLLTAEGGLMVVGLLLATGSSLFAARSIAENTGRVPTTGIVPQGQLMAWKKGIAESRLAAMRDLDPLTTGSIPDPLATARVRANDAEAFASGAPLSGGREIGRYVLLDVTGGTALVESADGIRQVRPGSVLPGAGRVSAIERSGGAWVVMTSEGVIRDQR